MKTKKDSFKERVPKVKINPSLDKYDNIVAFPEKLAKTNKILKKTGHPKEFLDVKKVQ